MKVEVDVLGSPSLTVLNMVYVDVKQYLKNEDYTIPLSTVFAVQLRSSTAITTTQRQAFTQVHNTFDASIRATKQKII